VPVECSVVWDMSLVRGEYPARAWNAERLQDRYRAAFGGRIRRWLVALLNRLQAVQFPRDGPWSAGLCRRVRQTVGGSVPVFCEGGVRTRREMERLLGADAREPACDLVGMGRPFYAEPRLGARLLGDRARSDGSRALCASCNNCTVPQVTGAPGRCRTPSVVRERARLESDGVYDRQQPEHRQ